MSYANLLGAEPGEDAEASSADEVAEIVARAASAKKSVIPWGGGTGQDYGYLPRSADILLDLSPMNRILAHEPGDLTVTVEAGATLADVQKTLAAHNQFLPLDPPHGKIATLGGILATNAFGPLRLGYGTARDWLIGLTVVDAQGRIVRGGGKVVKNVTGYDLPKLHIGALGTLGVIVEATFKVAPKPEASRSVLLNMASDGDGAAFLARLREETSPSLALLTGTTSGRWGAFGFTGPQEVVDDAIERAIAAAANYGLPAPTLLPEGKLNPFSDAAEDTPLLLRVQGKASEAYEQNAAVTEAAASWLRVDTLAGTGCTEAAAPPDADDDALTSLVVRMTQWAKERGGSTAPLALIHAPAHLRRGNHDLWQPLPPALPLMQKLKATLDPDGILNPGRFLGRL